MTEKTKTKVVTDSKKLEIVELGQKKIKEREAEKVAAFEARKKEVLEEETALVKKIEKNADDLTPGDQVLLKRMKNRVISERKEMEAKERAAAVKTFKVHVEGATAPCVIAKARNKAEAIKKTKGAYRAFEVADGYKG